MAKLTFVGGIHPYDGKDLSKDKPIKVILPQGEMVYPLSQHIGAPTTPIVEVGDMVKRGDIVGEAGKGLSVNIHASISGKVVAVTKNLVTIKRA